MSVHFAVSRHNGRPHYGCEDRWRWFTLPFGPDLSFPLQRLHWVSFSSSGKAFITIIPISCCHGNTLWYVIIYFLYPPLKHSLSSNDIGALSEHYKHCVHKEWLLGVWLYRFFNGQSKFASMSATLSVQQMWGANVLARWPEAVCALVIQSKLTWIKLLRVELLSNRIIIFPFQT